MIPELNIDPAQETERIVAFMQQQLASAGFHRVVLGLSGGVDSSLTAALAVRAVGAENMLGMILPYRTSNPDSENDARTLVAQLGVPCDRFDISPLVDALAAAYPDMDARRKGNVMARCRMLVLFDQAARFRGLGMGTSNRTETLLGYFTIFGDGAAAMRPIAHLYKCQVRALARYLALPAAIIDKAPSADLWEGQTDEGELGFSYNTADQVLYLLTEQHLSEPEIVSRGFAAEAVEAIAQRMAASAFKRALPPSLEP
jgi:NAD+ synthase